MRKLLLAAWMLIQVLDLNAQQVITTSNLNLRSRPGETGTVLLQIPKGTTLELDDCRSGWCHVSVNGQDGYITKKFTRNLSVLEPDHIANRQAHPTEPVRYYQNSDGRTVQSPTHYDAVPAGATAQCRDGSYSFSQHRRGTCSHHGGVKRWLN